MRYILVLEQLLGSQQPVKRITAIGVTADIGYIVVYRRAVADIIAGYDNVIRLQRIRQQGTDIIQSFPTFRGNIVGRADRLMVIHDDAVTRHTSVENV